MKSWKINKLKNFCKFGGLFFIKILQIDVNLVIEINLEAFPPATSL